MLEKHHAATAFRLLRRHGLLSSLSAADYAEVRRLVGEAILGTDMAAHTHAIGECASLTVSKQVGKGWGPGVGVGGLGVGWEGSWKEVADGVSATQWRRPRPRGG